jgi:hypothetical protein
MAQTKPKEPPLQNISISLKAQTANANMKKNVPMKDKQPSNQG